MIAPVARDEERTSSSVRALVRCDTKGCRKPHTVAFETTTITLAFNGRMAQRREVTYRGRTWPYQDRNDLARGVVGQFTCTGCGGHSWSWAVIEGHFSESVACGPRCRNAVGASCDCRCGGENHATSHSAL